MNQGEPFHYVWAEYALDLRPSHLAALMSSPRVRSAESKTHCSVQFTRRVLNKRRKFNGWARYSILRITGPDDQSIGQCNRLLEQAIPGYQWRKDYTRRAPITVYSRNVEAEGDLRSRLSQALFPSTKRGLSESDVPRAVRQERLATKTKDLRALSVKSHRDLESPFTVLSSEALDISAQAVSTTSREKGSAMQQRPSELPSRSQAGTLLSADASRKTQSAVAPSQPGAGGVYQVNSAKPQSTSDIQGPSYIQSVPLSEDYTASGKSFSVDKYGAYDSSKLMTSGAPDSDLVGPQSGSSGMILGSEGQSSNLLPSQSEQQASGTIEPLKSATLKAAATESMPSSNTVEPFVIGGLATKEGLVLKSDKVDDHKEGPLDVGSSRTTGSYQSSAAPPFDLSVGSGTALRNSQLESQGPHPIIQADVNVISRSSSKDFSGKLSTTMVSRSSDEQQSSSVPAELTATDVDRGQTGPNEPSLKVALLHNLNEQSAFGNNLDGFEVKALITTEISFDSIPRSDAPSPQGQSTTTISAQEQKQLLSTVKITGPLLLKDGVPKQTGEHAPLDVVVELINPVAEKRLSPIVHFHDVDVTQADGSVRVDLYTALEFHVPTAEPPSVSPTADAQSAKALWTKELSFDVTDARAKISVAKLHTSMNIEILPLSMHTVEHKPTDIMALSSADSNVRETSGSPVSSQVNAASGGIVMGLQSSKSVPSSDLVKHVNVTVSVPTSSSAEPRLLAPSENSQVMPYSTHDSSGVDLTPPSITNAITGVSDGQLITAAALTLSHSEERHQAVHQSVLQLVATSKESRDLIDPEVNQVPNETRFADSSVHPPSPTPALLVPANSAHHSGDADGTTPQRTSPVSLATSLSTNLEVHVNRDTGRIDVRFELNNAPSPVGSEGSLPRDTYSADWNIKLEQNISFGPVGFVSSPNESRASPVDRSQSARHATG